MALRAMRYTDLLSVPYVKGGRNLSVGVDCLGQMLEVHRRLGMRGSAEAVTEDTARRWLLNDHWTHLGTDIASLRELGDVMLLPGKGCGELGVATLVDTVGSIMLTTREEMGARAMRAGSLVRIAGVPIGIYRWRGNRTEAQP